MMFNCNVFGSTMKIIADLFSQNNVVGSSCFSPTSSS